MSRLTDLIHTVRQLDPQLGSDLEAEISPLQERLPFGLNFERHQPEAVHLPGVAVRVGAKVRVLPSRGSGEDPDRRLWHIDAIRRTHSGARAARVSLVRDPGEFREDVPLDDLMLVAEFRDRIYPGLRSTGSVCRGGDRPFHTVINGENYHVLEALTYTHPERVDAIYIDPPYNTGARDWKYNNDYVESDDLYRHSKWLAFMERRLKIARKLLNPRRSALIVTIDEKEYLRLGLLLEQVFPDARIQMVSSVISSQGSVRDGMFTRADEYIYFVLLGDARIAKATDDMLNESASEEKKQVWFQFVRTGKGNLRADSKNLFYPIFVDPEGRIVGVGEPIPLGVPRDSITPAPGIELIWPLTSDGREARWRTGAEVARRRASKGLLRATRSTSRTRSSWSVMTVNQGTEDLVDEGVIPIEGYDPGGGARLDVSRLSSLRAPKTTWNRVSHNAGWHGSKLLSALLPGRSFPYPKSLYAVEDALRFVVGDNKDATIVDFFAGSGTTAHAVMRLNKQDNGRRQSISITNNEVGADEQRKLHEQGLRQGDIEWERWGICDYITKPRIEAAITGLTPSGDPIDGAYRFTDTFPMGEGFGENAEFFTLTYESVWRVSQNRAFAAIAPLLWLRAGAVGRRIDALESGWDVADAYGVLEDLDQAADFVEAVRARRTVKLAYIITDDDRRYQMVSESLGVETVRLYSSYLQNFQINNGIAS